MLETEEKLSGSVTTRRIETAAGKRGRDGDHLNFLSPLKDWLNTLDPQVAAWVLDVLRVCFWLTALAVVFTPLERLFALRPQKIFRKAIVTDLGYYFLNSLVPAVLLSFPLACVGWAAHRLVPSGLIGVVVGLPLWARLTAAMVVGEVGSYWGHRWTHEVPFLWRFHAIHHSAEEMDFLVSTRAHPLDIVFTRLCELTPMYVLGLASPMSLKGSLVPIVAILLGQFWGFFIHANVKWRFGWLEWLVSTPGFHHWHHTNDGPTYINKNYSPMLPWVDWLFGTLYLPKNKTPEKYGTDEVLSPVLFGQLVEPLMVWRKPGESAADVTAAAQGPEDGAASDVALVAAEADAPAISS